MSSRRPGEPLLGNIFQVSTLDLQVRKLERDLDLAGAHMSLGPERFNEQLSRLPVAQQQQFLQRYRELLPYTKMIDGLTPHLEVDSTKVFQANMARQNEKLAHWLRI